MALTGAQHTATGTAVKLSTLISRKEFKQLDVIANSGNAAVIYLGPATVTAAGANAWVALAAGKSWGARVDRADQLEIQFSELYIIGTASDKAHIAVLF